MTSSTIKVYNPFTDPIIDVIGETKRTWIAWLKALFAARPVGRYRWLPNPTETEIAILDQGPYNSEEYNGRPAIVTILGPGSWTQGGLTTKVARLGFPFNNPTTFLGLSAVSISLKCLSSAPEEARRLAYYVYRLIPVFEEVLQRFGIHGVANQLIIGQESPGESLVQGSSAPEWKMVAVDAQYTAKDALVVEDAPGESTFQPRVRQITIQMTSLLTT